MKQTLKQWLAQERGRTTALADLLGLTIGRASQMAATGVPTRYMFLIQDFTGGAVTVETMVAERSARRKPLAKG